MKKFILALVIPILVLIFISSYTTKNMKIEEQRVLAILDSYELNIPEIFEYEDRIINLNDFVTSNNLSEKLFDDEESKQSLKDVGKHNVNLTLNITDKYHRTYEKVLSQEYEIVDTNYPVIVVNAFKITINEGEELNLNTLIDSVYDIVDGELEYSDIPKSGCYWFENLPDNKPGEYEVILAAEDINKNKTVQQLKVVINKVVSKKSSVINFDIAFSVKTPAGGNVQSLLDKGYIVHYVGDYFHHNTSKFLNLFWQCSKGTKVIIDGITYTSGGIYHGYVYEHKIYYDDGSLSWYKNERTELITCASGTDKRWILILY